MARGAFVQGVFVWGFMSGGFLPGGFCPDTSEHRRCSTICCVPLFAWRCASLPNTNNLVIQSKNGEANVQCGQRKILFSE